MKRKLSILSAMFLFFGTMAFGQNSMENKDNFIDDVNFSLPASRAIPEVGQLNSGSPTFIRPTNIPLSTVGYDPACGGAFALSGTNPSYYAAYTFTATATEELVLTVETPNSGICCSQFDPMVLLYCGTFDPANPLTNLRAGNDDAGTGFWAAFPTGSGVMVQAGNDYTIVVTHWATIPNLNGNPLDFTLTVQNDVVLNSFSVPLSDWAIGIGIALILMAALVRLRKLS